MACAKPERIGRHLTRVKLEIVVAYIVAVLALVAIVREDRPRTIGDWGMTLFAAAQLGVACGFAIWFVRLLIDAGWAVATRVLLITAAVFYVWIGAQCAAWELRSGKLRGVVYAVVVFLCWPVVLYFAARALAPADDS